MQKQTEHGIKEYAVSPQAAAAALSNTITFHTGLLDAHTLCVRTEGIKRTIVEHRPRQKTPLWLEGSQDAIIVPLPDLLMVCTFTANGSPSHQVYAVSERPTSYDAPLYHAPLPNVYNTTHGGVCWGTVPLVANDPNSTSLAAHWRQLFSTRFGSHSASGKCKSHSDDVRKLYVDMEQRRTRVYPKKELIPARRTLRSVLGVDDG